MIDSQKSALEHIRATCVTRPLAAELIDLRNLLAPLRPPKPPTLEEALDVLRGLLRTDADPSGRRQAATDLLKRVQP